MRLILQRELKSKIGTDGLSAEGHVGPGVARPLASSSHILPIRSGFHFANYIPAPVFQHPGDVRRHTLLRDGAAARGHGP